MFPILIKIRAFLVRTWISLLINGLWLLARIGGAKLSKRPLEDPKFEIGDLVMINNFGLLLQEPITNLGIIADGPYIFKTTTHSHLVEDLFYFEYWTYDILVGGKLIKMMPETFLEEVKSDEDEQDN
jgi:hypothetical protein